MRLIVYDCEVFKYDWLVVFKDHESGQYIVIHNDNEALKACISEDCIYVGFNSSSLSRLSGWAVIRRKSRLLMIS